jgi:hypothetical protein
MTRSKGNGGAVSLIPLELVHVGALTQGGARASLHPGLSTCGPLARPKNGLTSGSLMIDPQSLSHSYPKDAVSSR